MAGKRIVYVTTVPVYYRYYCTLYYHNMTTTQLLGETCAYSKSTSHHDKWPTSMKNSVAHVRTVCTYQPVLGQIFFLLIFGRDSQFTDNEKALHLLLSQILLHLSVPAYYCVHAWMFISR